MDKNRFVFHISFNSLIFKMIFFGFLVSVVPLVIYQLITLEKSADVLEGTYAHELIHKTELTTLLIDQAIAHNISETRSLLKSILFIRDKGRLTEFLREISDFRNDIASITLLEASGKIAASTSDLLIKNSTLDGLPQPVQSLFHLTQSAPAGGIFVSEALMMEGELSVILMARTQGSAAQTPLYLAIAMSFNNIELLLSDFEDEVEGKKSIYLIDKKGQVVFSHDPALPAFSTFDAMDAIKINGRYEPDAPLYVDDAGLSFIPSVGTVSSFGENGALGWSLLAFVPYDIITDRVNATLRSMIWISLLIILATVVMAYIMARNITRPVKQMVTMTQRLRSGDYSSRITTDTTASDEITTLADTLNDMAAKIEKHTRRLREQNTFIRFILDASPSFTVTVKEGAVEYINKTFLAFLGYPAMEAFNAAGENLCRRIHQINDRLIRDEPNETIQVMLTQSQQQIVYFRNDKGEISSPYIASFSCFDDQRKCIFTFTDVTQIEGQKSELKEKVKQAEAKQEKQRRIMEIQERQSQMGEMIGSIAHQWKQPLNLLSISAYDISETFRAGEMDKTYMEKYLHNINQTIRFMSSTIDDFRNFFQPSSVPFPFSPETAIKNILKMMGKLYTLQNIDITVTSDESLYVQGAENEFQQVIVNLLNNAKDAFLEKNLPDRTINIHIAKTNEAIRIDVCDNAGGIPESLIDQVFDSYFSTKTVDKGTGIGLYMSRQIIETKMQGTLTVANKNGGACFTITLPKLDA